MFKYGKKKPQGATRHAPKNQTASRPKSPLSSWLLVGFGITVGLFVASGLYWWQPWRPVAQNTTADPKTAQANTANTSADPKFVFYDLLPNQEVLTQAPEPTNDTSKTVAPTKQNTSNDSSKKQETQSKEKHTADKSASDKDSKSAKQADALDKKIAALQQEHKKEPPKDTKRYALQAGSFKSKAEAENRRASIMLAGLPVKVQKVTVKQGEEWYRVIVGPFTGKDNATDARKNLQREGVDSLITQQN